jgi:hypothetical protein
MESLSNWPFAKVGLSMNWIDPAASESRLQPVARPREANRLKARFRKAAREVVLGNDDRWVAEQSNPCYETSAYLEKYRGYATGQPWLEPERSAVHT